MQKSHSTPFLLHQLLWRCRSLTAKNFAVSPGKPTWEVRAGDGRRRQTLKLSGHVDQHDKRARSRSDVQRCVLTWLLCLALPCLATVTQAQERLGGEPPGRSGLPQLPTLEEQPSKPPTGPILPPLPPAAPGEPQQLPQRVRVLVRQIRVVGNTVFPMEKLSEVTQRYVNRELAKEDLEALRLELTRLYIDAGYINSGAIIPDQTVSEGVITLQIIEGELTTIEVSGTTWFRDSYIRKRLALGAEDVEAQRARATGSGVVAVEIVFECRERHRITSALGYTPHAPAYGFG